MWYAVDAKLGVIDRLNTLTDGVYRYSSDGSIRKLSAGAYFVTNYEGNRKDTTYIFKDEITASMYGFSWAFSSRSIYA